MTSSDSGMPESARGIGERLRQARVRAGLTPAEAGTRLKMPTHVIESLEREDWARLGAPVFIRGQLRSYARLLGMQGDIVAESVSMPAARPADLVPRTYTPRMQRFAEQAARRLVYVVITATIAVPVWLATRSHLDGALSSVPLDQATTTDAAADNTDSVAGGPQNAEASGQAATLVASMAPMPQRTVATDRKDLKVEFSGESWIRLTAPDGTLIEQALVPPGQQREFAPGQIGSAVLGNAQAISVQYRGQKMDLAPYIRANVVRFTVSSDGSLQPVDR